MQLSLPNSIWLTTNPQILRKHPCYFASTQQGMYHMRNSTRTPLLQHPDTHKDTTSRNWPTCPASVWEIPTEPAQ